MHDALLTIGVPLEKFYGSLTDEQHQRLRRAEPDARESAAKPAGERGQGCAAPVTTHDPMQAIERAMPPTEPQRASFEAFRQSSAAMARLIAQSCPASPLSDPMGRFAAASDRLDVMLFAVMTMSSPLQAFYDSLDENQKRGLSRAFTGANSSGS
jgi:hypothetical protein